MESIFLNKNQERAKMQRNYEYQLLQNKIESSDKKKHIEWWKDNNDQDIKPYSVSYHPISKTLVFFFKLN